MDTSSCQVSYSTITIMYFSTFCLHVTGGDKGYGTNLKEVLKYDTQRNRWTNVGQLSTTRRNHAMSLVPKETANYCV